MDPPPPTSWDVIAVSTIRGIETEVVSADTIRALGEQLLSDLGPSARALDTPAGQDCSRESCRLAAAEAQGATHMLHSRLIQYGNGANCILLSTLFHLSSKRSEWGFVRELPCEKGGLSGAISELSARFARRPTAVPRSGAFAVIPVQHKIEDLAWASESLGEYLTAVLAELGWPMLPAGYVARPLVEGNAKPHRACGNKRCAIDLASTALAQRAITTEVTKRKKTCSLETKIYDVGTKTSTRTAKAKGGCEAVDLAAGLREMADALTPLPPLDDAPAAAPPPTASPWTETASPPPPAAPPPPAEPSPWMDPPPPSEPPPPTGEDTPPFEETDEADGDDLKDDLR